MIIYCLLYDTKDLIDRTFFLYKGYDHLMIIFVNVGFLL
jgi:hypothetical protein